MFALAVAAGLLAGALPAAAGDVTGKDRVGDVSAPQLTQAERDAMDVVAVRATGDTRLGVVVVETFRGHVERALGRGHLAKGLVAMILRPKSAGASPAVLATSGTAVDAVRRKTRSEQVGVVRSGRTIMFFVGGSGYANVGRVEVRTFRRVPTAARRTSASGPPTLSDAEFKEIATLPNLDKLVELADSKQLTCAQLEHLNAGILFYIQALTKADFREGIEPSADRELIRLQGFQAAIKTRLDDQCRGLPKTPEAEFAWSYFGTSKNEVTGKGHFRDLSGRKVIAIQIRVPDHDIDAALCPPQLPKLSYLARDKIECRAGNALPGGVEFTANVRTTPNPEKFMGGRLTATLDDGSKIGPFAISGP